MGGGVGDGAAGATFLAGGGIEGHHGGVNVLALPEGVEGALVLRGASVGFPDLIARAIHDFVGFGPVAGGLVGEEGFGRDGGGGLEESGGEEGGVTDFFAGVACSALAGVEAIGGVVLSEKGTGDGRELVGFGGDEEADHFAHVPVGLEFKGEPVEEVEVGGPVALVA